MKEIILKISGMTCEHCKASVEGALNNLKGVNQADVSLSENTAKVVYDEKVVDIEKMKSAVYDIGFEVVD